MAGRRAHESRQEWTLDQLGQYLLGEEGVFARSGQQRPNTRRNYLQQWNLHVKEQIGWIKLSRLEVVHVEELILGIWGKKKFRTAQAVRNLIHLALIEGRRLKLYKGHYKEGYIEGSLIKLRKVKAKKGTARILSISQSLSLLESIEDPVLAGAVALGAIVGLRKGEVLGLVWSSLDLSAGTVKIERQYQEVRNAPLEEGAKKRKVKGGAAIVEHAKTESGERLLPLPQLALAYLKKVPITSAYVFPGKDLRRPMHPRTLYGMLKKAIASHNKVMRSKGLSELPDVTFHELRHSANNNLKQIGVDSVTRRDILGHSDVRTTDQIYTQTIDPEIAASWAELDRRAGVVLELDPASEGR